MLLQIITICISVSNKFYRDKSGDENGMGWSADRYECATGGGNELRIFFAAGELQGKFDASGEVCFDLPTLGENYVSATISGVTDARLLDENNRRLRTLLAGGPPDGEQTLLFSCR